MGKYGAQKLLNFIKSCLTSFINHAANNTMLIFIKYSVLSYKVDLLKVTTINGIATEGSNGRYIKKFSLTYTTESDWIEDTKQFDNNGEKVGIFCFLSEQALT